MCDTTILAAIAAALATMDDEEDELDAFFMDTPTKKREYERSTPSPTIPLQIRHCLFRIFEEDDSREYCKVLTSLSLEEFEALASLLKDSIESSQTEWTENNLQEVHQTKRKRSCKLNYKQRLFLTLYWLHSGMPYRELEYFSGWSKSSIERDIKHVLDCILYVLDKAVSWPSRHTRNVLSNATKGIFKGCIGIVDCTEHEIAKPKNNELQRQTYSGKSKANVLKTITVIDRSGKIIWIETGYYGKMNDLQVFKSTNLYLKSGEYLDGDQFLIGDGVFKGCSKLLISYDNIKDDHLKTEFNLAFTSFRLSVEDAIGRIKMWFPILGRRKAYWDLDHLLLIDAIHVSARLHNWLMDYRNRDYDPTLATSNLYAKYY